ncbi:MAG TPA: fructose-6-phosphate aldolase [Armatimonadetes bacterium]|nr:fructose-6-phosphate aldolase [Armatimonadota bacterium]
MKIFLDTADVAKIRELYEWGVVDGVTTNPTHIAATGRPFMDVVREILDIVDGPVSLEVVSTDADGMIDEARRLARLHERNVVIKIPCIPEGLKASKVLSQEGIKINMTLVFSANQALLAAKAGATYISPFVGRLDGIGHDGMEVVQQIAIILDNYGFESQIIASALRHPMHVLEAALCGAHVATVRPEILEQMMKHPLTDDGLQRFLDDWKKVPGGLPT